MTKTKRIILAITLGLFLIFSYPLNSYASEITRDGVIGLINKERTERGLNSLAINSRLSTAAQWKADDMIEKDYWEHFHNGKSPWDWIKEANYDYLDAGENLAIDFTELEPMHQAWMNSPTHRENIINSKYKEVGIGITRGDFEGHQTIIVVQMFGNPVPEQVAQKTESPIPANYESKSVGNQFVANADEDISRKEVAKVKNQPENNKFKAGFSLVKRFFIFIFNSYKLNVKKGYAQFRSIGNI